MKRRLLIICTIASLTAPLFADDGFDFDDLEEIEKVEKQEQLQIKNKKSKEEKRQRATQRQQSSSGGSSSSVYIVDWGYDFSGGDKLWGRNGVKLSNGRKIYMWLNKQSYGLKCYNLSIQGSFYGNASLCEVNRPGFVGDHLT